MKANRLILLLVLLPLLSLGQNNFSVVYEADENGKTISGNLDTLRESIQHGNPVRVGWLIKLQNFDKKVYTIEHWADAGFLTIVNKHVYAQLKPIYEQGINFETQESAVFLIDGKPNGWVSVISTSGVMKQKFRDILQGTEGMTKEEIDDMVKSLETTRVATKWAVQKS
ncbi:hypothetical protein [uncultured Algibacter sp.]|uniref:hypothetical protein n=1 Tax=uncultured Algibacter sp. TaxID=298659 RepID=UPI00321728C1